MSAPSRSARRNQHKRLARSLKSAEAPHSPLACRWLAFWQGEAIRRAERLGAPAAWQLLSEPTVTARLWRLDPSGELAQDLARLIAEAVARASDSRLVRRGRPVGVVVERQG
jgi:hypothetical protein